MSVLRTVDGIKEWGPPHGKWEYKYDAANDEDWWSITWHHNFIDAGTRVKTAIFKKLKTIPHLPLWYYDGGTNRAYCSVLRVVDPPVVAAAGSSAAAAGSSAVWSEAVS